MLSRERSCRGGLSSAAYSRPAPAREDTRLYMLRAVDINDLALIGQSSANLTSPARRAENGKGVRRPGRTPFQIASVLGTRGVSTSQLYGLLTTTCGAGLFTSSWALTFWI